MQKYHQTQNKTAFTLIELIIVLAVLAIIIAIAIPLFISLKDQANATVCKTNQNQIVRYYYVNRLQQENPDALKLSDVLAKSDEIFSDHHVMCPSGGTYTADDEKNVIICSIHGNTENPPTNPVNTTDMIYLSGDEKYPVKTWGDIETFDYKASGQPGTIIPNGTVFYYRGSYYLFRDNQYFNDHIKENLSTYIAKYGVKIDTTAFKSPSPSTNPGDIKLVDGKTYAFFPYSRYANDYLNNGWWFEVKSK